MSYNTKKEGRMTISYQELLSKSDEFISYLEKQGVIAQRKEDSFRDYHVKIIVDDVVVILYHKPTKKTFSIGTQEIKNPAQKSTIEELWGRFQNGKSVPVQGLCAYVDGSFFQQKIGWGLVLVEDDEVIDTFGGKIECPIAETSHQIAGEIQGVLEAIKYATQNNYTSITIFYDYVGLQKWACGEWKANSTVAKNYIEMLKHYSIDVKWVKVKAHTGDKFNEMADKIAKK